MATRLRLVLAVLAVAGSPIIAAAQAVLTTLSVESSPGYFAPVGIAVNPVTNQIYVGNGNGIVTAIDGASNGTTDITVGGQSNAIAVNPSTNKIYAVITGGSCGNCVAVIDGATNTLQASIAVGNGPMAVAVNSVTNKIYVINNPDNTVTAIDGATNRTTTIAVGTFPVVMAINSVTNKIYVVNQNSANMTIIDGASNNTTTFPAGGLLLAIAVNPVTNKIYLLDELFGMVIVIDGATLDATGVPGGLGPFAIAVNTVTNKIYVADECSDIIQHCSTGAYIGTVTVIDGNTNSTLTIDNTPSYFDFYCTTASAFYYCPQMAIDSQRNKVFITGFTPGDITVIDGATNDVAFVGIGELPAGVAYNPVNNKVYVPNSSDGTVSVVDPEAWLQFVPLTPCRVVDTRNPNGPFGGPPLEPGFPRDFVLPQGGCNIPPTALAYSLNVTAVPHGFLDYLSVLPAGSRNYNAISLLNSDDGRVKANAILVQAGVNAGVSVYDSYDSQPTDVILDVNGYFTVAANSTLAFFPLPPCRVVDTRGAPGDLGGPALQGGVPRSFPVLEAASCNIPSGAQAYSMNFTAVPHRPLGYLTVWPTGEHQPLVSTLNAPTGTVVANAALVPAGDGGAISAYASDDTDLVADINGYFAPANSGANPLSFYILQPCRGLDTRNASGAFQGTMIVNLSQDYQQCPIPLQALTYNLNATVLPNGPLGYITLWPDGGMQPLVSTLNAYDGAVTSNMAVVPVSNALIDGYASNLTQLLLDISGYFAP